MGRYWRQEPGKQGMGKVIKREEREERKVKRPEKEKKRKSEDEGE